ncbi:PhzF family phenazine biosynthesis protein, partial [Robbsia andropogonis]|uniref:PhzF family phenazine biosynthesis protein n=2 Tax=Robbsia andropogonis TaxID=28092 RepID=UPI001EEE34F6
FDHPSAHLPLASQQMTTTEHAVAPVSLFPVERLTSFADGNAGGNPAGVVICEALPDADTVQAIAAEVGYSETASAVPLTGAWRVQSPCAGGLLMPGAGQSFRDRVRAL